MRTLIRKRSRTVQAKSAEEFDREFNRISEELSEDAELVWDTAPMCVHFIYEEHTKVAESAADQFALHGLKMKCRNCPHLEKPEDGRVKKCFCPFAFANTTREDQDACEEFYREVLAGEIKAKE